MTFTGHFFRTVSGTSILPQKGGLLQTSRENVVSLSVACLSNVHDNLHATSQGTLYSDCKVNLSLASTGSLSRILTPMFSRCSLPGFRKVHALSLEGLLGPHMTIESDAQVLFLEDVIKVHPRSTKGPSQSTQNSLKIENNRFYYQMILLNSLNSVRRFRPGRIRRTSKID